MYVYVIIIKLYYLKKRNYLFLKELHTNIKRYLHTTYKIYKFFHIATSQKQDILEKCTSPFHNLNIKCY